MKTIVYHDTVQQASRSRRPQPNETVHYRAKKDWCLDVNESFDTVIDLSTPKPKKKKDDF